MTNEIEVIDGFVDEVDEADEEEMKWNYRIICTEDGFAFHECFYEDDQSTPDSMPDSWTGSPAEPYGTSQEELIENLLKFNRAVKMPILYEIGGDLMELEIDNG